MTFNIGADKGYTINELSETIQYVTDINVLPIYLNERPQEVKILTLFREIWLYKVWIQGSFLNDMGHVLENYVYVSLRDYKYLFSFYTSFIFPFSISANASSFISFTIARTLTDIWKYL